MQTRFPIHQLGDETKPACRRCSVRDDPCTYPTAVSSPSVASGSASTRPPLEQLKASSQRGCRTPTHKLELRLLHHFAHETLSDIGGFHPPEHQAVLTSPEVLDHTYLLDATFALASLHIAWQEREHANDYREIAAIYESKALKGFPTMDASQSCLAMVSSSHPDPGPSIADLVHPVQLFSFDWNGAVGWLQIAGANRAERQLHRHLRRDSK
jgi:hypothetical protein